MTQDAKNLIWIDLEMTGLRPDADYIIEIATLVTDSALSVVAEGPELVVHQPDAILDSMDEWNQTQHHASMLVDRVRDSRLSHADAERLTLEFLEQHVPPGASPMCGNSVCQDRRFLYRHMPELERYFHYRNLDVSSLKVLAQRWAPEVAAGVHKHATHRASQDIRESLEELRHYRAHLFSGL